MRRRALLIGVPGRGINVSLAAERLSPLLSELGFTVSRCVGSKATREAVLAAIDRFVRQTQTEDTCFIHYFGHGGRITFTDLEGPFAETIFGFVSTFKQPRASEFGAILDVELSARLTVLDRTCANVTVMLDCCYSAELVRDTATPLSRHYSAPAPEVVRELLAQPRPTLALDSHPRIVRLCGASARREAYAAVRQGRNIGHMTDCFIDILRERSAEEIACLSWGALIHELRERVINRLDFEGQWVALAGPRNRLLFSREQCELPATVSFVAAGSEPGHGWIRAGWLQGVGLGDRWAVLDAALDHDGQARVLARGTIRELERSRARLELDEGVETELPIGSPACPVKVLDAMPVRLPESSQVELAGSAWLRELDAHDEEAGASLRSTDAGLLIEDPSGALPAIRLGNPSSALELLEHRARVRALLRSLTAHEPDPCALEWGCFLVDGGAPLERGARLCVGDRIRVEVRNPVESPPHNWFFSALLVEADGRLRLLNARMPEGLEICPLAREQIGVREGRHEQGFELRWPGDIDAPAAPISVLFLASRRTIALAHIVREQPLDEDEALAFAGLVDPARHTGPSPTPACAWARLEFVLHRK